MFILLSGRMGSGKTVLSNELVSKGYEKVSFASYLRELVSNLYSEDVSLYKSQEGKAEHLDYPLKWNKRYCKMLFEDVGEEYLHEVNARDFYTRREALQYIGSDVLKRHNKNFHADKLMQSLSDKKDYVCDDLRFPDELEVASKFESKAFHIIRPSNRNVSNHISETSLNWTYFENVIINMGTEQDFKDNFDWISENYKLKNYKSKVTNIGEKSTFLFPTRRLSYFAAILNRFKYINNELSGSFTKKDFYKWIYKMEELMPIIKNSQENSSFFVSDPFIIENLKSWQPEYDGIPNIIRDNDLYIQSWNEGIKDGNALLI